MRVGGEAAIVSVTDNDTSSLSSAHLGWQLGGYAGGRLLEGAGSLPPSQSGSERGVITATQEVQWPLAAAAVAVVLGGRGYRRTEEAEWWGRGSTGM